MEISFITNAGNLTTNNGYGKAGYGLVTSLQRLGHSVPFASPTAPVEIAFCQPDYSEWSNPDGYHIQYTPWESTALHPGWVEAFNDNCDEVWTTSDWCAQVYKEAGVTRPIYVYEHGVTALAPRSRRMRGPKLKILHVGEPAMRKGGQMAFDAFREVFGNRTDVSLTIKAFRRSAVRVYDRHGSILGLPHEKFSNVVTVYNDVTDAQMGDIYAAHDALVYPSYGEGFGFIPAEAAMTGMPVLSPHEWAPYKDFLIPDLAITSSMEPSPWPDTHPGKMFTPHYDSLVAAYRQLDANYDYYAGLAYKNSFGFAKAYDWDRLTEQAFSHIVEKFS